jgi:uncharacterized protein (TIGR03086 family)
MRAPSGGIGLLVRAIAYGLGNADVVETPELLARRTPCADWDLGALLRHVGDSVDVLHEGIDGGGVRGRPAGTATDPEANLVDALRRRHERLLNACMAADGDRPITIAGCPLDAGIVASTGAVEIAVHAWDISRACGLRRPIPPELAIDVLTVLPAILTDATRAGLFAAPVAVSSSARPGDRLLAFLGRDPAA